MKTEFFGFLNQTKDWGMNLVTASSTAPRERVLEVYRKTAIKLNLVGRLSRENGEFVFRYDPGYVGEPISAFSTMNQEYRSSHLWPFFAIRIPPLDREDMRKEITNRSLRKDQIIEILGSVAKISLSNPYGFKLN